jgi:hypothetical protein
MHEVRTALRPVVGESTGYRAIKHDKGISMKKETTHQEPKHQEIKLQEVKHQETKKPTNPPANTMPTDGYVLSIDHKFKTSFTSAKDAMVAGVKLKQSYPVIQVAVYDAMERVYIPLDMQQPEK